MYTQTTESHVETTDGDSGSGPMYAILLAVVVALVIGLMFWQPWNTAPVNNTSTNTSVTRDTNSTQTVAAPPAANNTAPTSNGSSTSTTNNSTSTTP